MRLTLVPVFLLSVPLALAGCSNTSSSPTATTDPSAGTATGGAAPASDGPLPTTMTFETNRGDIVIATDPAAPQTVAAQAALAQQGYFDDTPCHRLVTSGIYVLQCGDPTGTGARRPPATRCRTRTCLRPRRTTTPPELWPWPTRVPTPGKPVFLHRVPGHDVAPRLHGVGKGHERTGCGSRSPTALPMAGPTARPRSP